MISSYITLFGAPIVGFFIAYKQNEQALGRGMGDVDPEAIALGVTYFLSMVFGSLTLRFFSDSIQVIIDIERNTRVMSDIASQSQRRDPAV